jgi:hypothetical protein
MNKLSSLAATVGCLLVVSLAAAFLTASPSVAQGGPRVADVRVVNPETQPVPVNVNALPAVQVSNLPAVQVSSLPAVQVGNPDTNPVPVHVTNPASEPAISPVYAQASFLFDRLGNSDFKSMYTVPTGKVLIMEQATFQTQEDPDRPVYFYVRVTLGSTVQVSHLKVDDRFFDSNGVFRQTGNNQVTIYAPAGATVGMGVSRSGAATVGAGGSLTFTGRLVSSS